MAIENGWVAECLPCKWETHHDGEVDAITAAVDHVIGLHRDTTIDVRAARKMGHVQLRTIEASGRRGTVPAGGSGEPAPDTGDKGKQLDLPVHDFPAKKESEEPEKTPPKETEG
jgi:hypothetical protein